jgi:hypothetical protein
VTEIREPRPDDESALLTLNNTNAVQLSELTAGEFQQLMKDAWRVRVADDASALLIAFDHETERDSANYRWFRERFRQFVYIDRIVVSEESRGQGLARQLYEDVIEAARGADHSVVCAEVNVEPPNAPSHAMHKSMGFSKVSDETLADDKVVRYYIYEL